MENVRKDRFRDSDQYTQSYMKMMNNLSHFDGIRYSAYRTAMKMIEIQKSLGFDHVQLYDVAASFDQLEHKIVGQHEVVDMSSLSQMISSLLSISNYTDSLCTKDMVMNFLQHTFDRKQVGHIEVLSCKTLLVVLSQGSLESKIQFLFNHIKGHNNHVSKRHLARFLKVFVELATVLSEQQRFGIHLLPATIDTCFKQASSTGISLDEFVGWMLKEPQMLVWWMIMYRLKYVESVVHYVTCDGCEKSQFKGLLFECLKCRDYYQCQDCFLQAKISKGHLAEHPMQEQCKPRGLRRRRSMLKVVRRFFKRKKSPGRDFLPIDPTVAPQHTIASLLGESSTDIYPPKQEEKNLCFASRTICQSRDLLESLDDFTLSEEKVIEIGTPDLPKSPVLSSVRSHIEISVRETEALLNLLKASRNMEMPSSLQSTHMEELVLEIRKLTSRVTSAFRSGSGSPKRLNKIIPMESTPIITTQNDRQRRMELETLQSPIVDNEDNHKAESDFDSLRQLSLATLSSIHSDSNANASYWTCASQDLAEISGSDLTSLAPMDPNFEGYSPETSHEKVMNVLKHFQSNCIDMKSIERLSEALHQKIEDRSQQFRPELSNKRSSDYQARLASALEDKEETRL